MSLDDLVRLPALLNLQVSGCWHFVPRYFLAPPGEGHWVFSVQ